MLKNLIVGGLHRGRKVAVLMEVHNGILTVMDINGYSPQSFPKNVSSQALNKMKPQWPVVRQRVDEPEPEPEPEYDLSEFTL